MNEIGWKQRIGRAGFNTEPALFQKSKEKREKIEQQIKRFTNNNWFKKASPTKTLPYPEIPHIPLPRSPGKKYEEAMKTPVKQQKVAEEKPIDYSLSLKLSQSGVGNKSKKEIEQINPLQSQFYELKQSKMLSEKGQQKYQSDQKNKFPFISEVIKKQQNELRSVKRAQEQADENQIMDLTKSKIKVHFEQPDEEILKQSFERQQNLLLAGQVHNQKFVLSNNDKDSNRQTIKSAKDILHLTRQLQDKDLKEIDQQKKSIVLNKSQQQIEKPAQIRLLQEMMPNNSNKTSKDLDYSSGKIFFTSQFKQYMQNKSNEYEEPSNPQQLNETMKSNILDKVFNEEIKQPEFIQYLDLYKLKTKKAIQMMADFFELGYKRQTINLINGIMHVLRIVPKYTKLIKQARERKLLKYFMHIKLYKQYKRWKQTRKLNAESFELNQRKRLQEKCFNQWKNVVLDDYYEKQQRVDVYKTVIKSSVKQKIFKAWRMYLFYNKIQRQADKFRLGTLFRAWAKNCKQVSKERQSRALKLYYLKLAQKTFNGWIQGVNNLKHQNQKRYQAKTFRKNKLLAKGWAAWSRFMQDQLQSQERDYLPVEVVIEHKIDNEKIATINPKNDYLSF